MWYVSKYEIWFFIVGILRGLVRRKIDVVCGYSIEMIVLKLVFEIKLEGWLIDWIEYFSFWIGIVFVISW